MLITSDENTPNNMDTARHSSASKQVWLKDDADAISNADANKYLVSLCTQEEKLVNNVNLVVSCCVALCVLMYII